MRGGGSSGRGRAWRCRGAQLAALALILLALQAWLQRGLVSGMAPALYGQDPQGVPLALSDYRGRTVLVHFWATWCPVCRLEQGAIEAVARDWPVLTVAMQSGDARAVGAYLRARGLHQPVLVDETGALAARFGVGAVPASFIVDPAGRIRFRHRGYTTPWGLRARLWAARLLHGGAALAGG